MKAIRIIIIIFIGNFVCLSCSDLLTEKPVSYSDASNFFISNSNAESGLLGVYDVLAKLQHYGQWEMPVPTSDGQYFVRGTNSDNSRRDISHYLLTPANQWIESLWKWKYTGIDRANYFLHNLRNMEAYGEGDVELRKFEGEACFLRALLYFDLVRYWGDVPFKTEYSNSALSGILPRTDRMEIYEQIVSDLEIAKNQIGESISPERASESAARALLMRVRLHQAGFSLKMDGKLTEPATELKTVYLNSVVEEFANIEKSDFHKLNDDYQELWENYSRGILEPRESIFEIAFFSPDGSNEDSGVWGTYIGPQTDINSSYSRANAFFNINPVWYHYFDSTDARRDVSIATYQVDKDDMRVPLANENQWTPGKWRREWMGTNPKNPNNTDVNFVYIRYSDVLLMAAEAYNELGQSDKALNLINLIRERARVEQIDNTLSNYEKLYNTGDMSTHTFIPDGDLKGKIRRIIYWERGFEFCYEGLRKFDLIRWGILNDVLKSIPSGGGYIASETFITGKHELLPVPLREMDLNPELNGRNNPGY